jgi:hypothetical protein
MIGLVLRSLAIASSIKPRSACMSSRMVRGSQWLTGTSLKWSRQTISRKRTRVLPVFSTVRPTSCSLTAPESVRTIVQTWLASPSRLRMPPARNEETGKAGALATHRIYRMSFSRVYPEYVAKAERKGRTKAEVDEIIRWLTGYDQAGLDAQLEQQTDIETFIADAPNLNPARALIKGKVCGVQVEAIEEPTMREIRYLDKLIDELAKGRPMEKILRA